MKTNQWHHEEKPHNSHQTPGRQSTLSLFPIQMIAKQEWTKINVKQNIDQLQNPTIEVTTNNESTTTEPPHHGQHGGGGGA